MPGTPNGAVDNEALIKRAVIMGAVGSNGKDLVPRPRQQNIVIVNTPEQHLSVAKRRDRDALSEIRLR